MSDKWVEELKKIKEDTEKILGVSRKKEVELREKFKDDVNRILYLISSLAEPVVETFEDTSKQEIEQPKFESNMLSKSAYLKVPISHRSSIFGDIGLGFILKLTNSGYAVEVRESSYDTVQNRSFSSVYYINPPVKIEHIQDAIRKFLKDRQWIIERLEERSKRLRMELV